MEEFVVNEGQETVIDNGGGVDPNTADNTTTGEAVNEESFEDTATDSDKGSDKEVKKEAHTKEQNAENARRRREAEREAEKRKLRNETIIDTLGGKNPYTGEDMTDDFDVEEYLLMKDIEKKGGDPVGDYQKVKKQKDREAAVKQTKADQSQEWYNNDRANFEKDYPDVNVSELIADPDFREWADGKIGRKPLSDIYRGFIGFKSKFDERAKDIAAQKLANKNASPGALHNTNPVDNDFFTADQVRAMTREEVHKNYDKIRKSMERWKD